MRRLVLPFFMCPGLLALPLAGCKAAYSPNTYAANAAQQEAAVQRGVIVGVRQVLITPDGTVGAAAGGAVGGLAGSQLPAGSVGTALGAIGGTLVGGIGGAAAAKAAGETKGWEYIVQETGDKLVSVTQTSPAALPVGQHVLVIADSQQARIVPDYTVQPTPAPATPPPPKPSGAADGSAPEVNVSPLLPDTGAMTPWQLAPGFMPDSAAITPAAPAAPAPAAAASSTPSGAATPDAASTPAPATAAPSTPAATTVPPATGAASAAPAPAAPATPASTQPAPAAPSTTAPASAAPATASAPLPDAQKAPN